MLLKIETVVGAFILAALGVFIYMSFHIGSVRFDLARYAQYKATFKDVAGIAEKADVKIAGVKVGWVDRIVLRPADTIVELSLKVLKDFPLYQDAQAIVRQEGLLGVKFLDIVPGNPISGRIPAGGMLPYQCRQFVSIDEIFYTFKRIAAQVEKLSDSFKNVSHETQGFIKDLKKRLDPLDALVLQLKNATESATGSIGQTAQRINAILDDVHSPVRRLGDLASKIEAGEGSLGKMLQDPHLYEDIKDTASYAKGCVDRISRVNFLVDNHLEILPRSFDDRTKTNVKWYFETRIFPTNHFFGLLGFVYSHQGFARRESLFDCDRCLSFKKGKSDAFRLQLQGGLWFDRRVSVGLRGGLFDGTAGVGLDLIFPFNRWAWMTTFEAYDFKGHNRFNNDRSPHLKWLNRLFFNSNIYLTFGADDFISKHNKSALIGIGALFSTCDLWRRC